MKPEPSTLSTPHKSNDAPHGKTPEDTALDKQILRSQIRPQRLIAKNARTAAEHEQMAQQYRDHILSLIPKDAQAQTIAAYLPTASEPPITAALHDLHARGHRILVPVVRPARTLAWVVWDPHVEHPLNGLGIAEPEGEEYDTQAFVAADLRLVPALAYARNGRRLGQGGGYYTQHTAAAALAAALGSVIQENHAGLRLPVQKLWARFRETPVVQRGCPAHLPAMR